MQFRVSTRPDGDRVWWREQGIIPGDHTNVRAATTDETTMVERILNHDSASRMPPPPQPFHVLTRAEPSTAPPSLGDRMRALLATWR